MKYSWGQQNNCHRGSIGSRFAFINFSLGSVRRGWYIFIALFQNNALWKSQKFYATERERERALFPIKPQINSSHFFT